MHLRLLRNEVGQDTPQTQCILTERWSHPVVAGGRRVALVENEIDDLENRRQTSDTLGRAGNLERDSLFGERPFGPDDALRDRRLRNQERARDLLGRQAAEQAERERDAGLGLRGAPGCRYRRPPLHSQKRTLSVNGHPYRSGLNNRVSEYHYFTSPVADQAVCIEAAVS